MLADAQSPGDDESEATAGGADRLGVERLASPQKAPANGPSGPNKACTDARLPRADFRALSGGRTPLGPGQTAQHLGNAWRVVTGSASSERVPSILWAHWALETARGSRMYGHNIGGIKAVGEGGSSASFMTAEGHGIERRLVRDRFRTYGSAGEGALDFVPIVQRRYPEAWAAAELGDANAYGPALDRRVYFTGDPRAYARAVHELSVEHLDAQGALPRLAGRPGGHLAPPLVEGVLHELTRGMFRRLET